MNPLLTLADSSDNLVPIVGIVFGCLVGLGAVIVNGVRASRERRHREESRREIAAYVAEGSMSVETAERLLEAGERAPTQS